MATRRQCLFAGGAATLAAGLFYQFGAFATIPAKTTHTFEVTLSDAQWREKLTPEQYRVLRQDGTEYPFASPLNKEYRAGTFSCAGCALPLFSSAAKYDSRTGWPSFGAPLENAVVTDSDTTFGIRRTAVACRRCGGHLGHVFDDGPQPTGLRYCMNGVAMTFAQANNL